MFLLAKCKEWQRSKESKPTPRSEMLRKAKHSYTQTKKTLYATLNPHTPSSYNDHLSYYTAL